MTLLAGCTGYGRTEYIDGINYGISASGKKAFVSELTWDGSAEPQTFVIPEQIDGAEVTALGGYYGTGGPMPFCVRSYESSDRLNDIYYVPGSVGAPVVFEDVQVTISLPKTVTEAEVSLSNGWVGRRNEYGELVFRRPKIRFECAEDNPEFTVKDGKLVLREDGSEAELAEGFYAEDGSPELTLREKLCGRYVKEGGSEKTVYDVFSEFGRVYMHINSYMDGGQYMFNALELIPLEEGIMERTDTDAFDAEVRQFSDFAMGGEYTDPGMPYLRVTVLEDSIGILSLDETMTPYIDSGVEFPKDNTQPSQFPYAAADLAPVNPDEHFLRNLSYYVLRGLTAGVLEFDGGEMRIRQDGTVTVRYDADNTAVVWRGLLMGAGNKDDYDLRFNMTKTGGTLDAHLGRVHFEFNENSEVVFTKAEGFESYPLIPEGKDSLTCRIS